QEPFTPARYKSGGVPALSQLAVGGGEVLVDVAVSAGGRVESVTALRTPPPFPQAGGRWGRGWGVPPAGGVGPRGPSRPDGPPRSVAVASHVLVAATFRQPTVVGPTHGEPPKDVAAPSEETPSANVAGMPTYPVTARDAGVVIVEARIDRAGTLRNASVV